jgi:hypothetical protein
MPNALQVIDHLDERVVHAGDVERVDRAQLVVIAYESGLLVAGRS